jgi:hypothetical protein
MHEPEYKPLSLKLAQNFLWERAYNDEVILRPIVVLLRVVH